MSKSTTPRRPTSRGQKLLPVRPSQAAAALAIATTAALPAAAQTIEQLQGLSIEELGNIQVTSVSKRPDP